MNLLVSLAISISIALVARLSVKKVIASLESCLFTEVFLNRRELGVNQLTRELTIS